MHKLVVAPLHYFYSALRDPFPTRVDLGNGYILQPFNSRILETVFNFFSDAYTEHEKIEIRGCRYAIYYSYETDNESSEIPAEVVTEITRIVNTLRIVKPTRAMPTVFHLRVNGRRKEALQIVHQPLTNITFPPRDPGSQHFNIRDAYKLRLYLKRVRFLYQNFGGNYHKVLNAIIFFEIGHENHLYKPRIVHFVTCLESLFNTSSQQVGYSLRMRCSYFLERRPQNRRDLARLVKNIYDLRSLFVHGQSTPPRLLANQAEQERLLVAAEDVSRRCLQKIFDKDLIAIFGNVHRLNEAFEDLEMGLRSDLS